MSSTPARVAGSFRDPGGFLFRRDGVLYRQINAPALNGFTRFVDSGLHAELGAAGKVVEHQDADIALAATGEGCKVIRPEPIPFIAHPYEWCFSQLKAAALLTLDLQEHALRFDLCLKDASAYNVQFNGCRPVFIDTLSFDVYQEGKPWVAYGQFCRHFLAPLLLMAKVDIALGKLLATHIDGIPVALASRLAPWTALLRPSLAMHIGLHGRSERAAVSMRDERLNPGAQFGLNAMRGLVDSLRSAIESLRWNPTGTEWIDYYTDNNNYGDAALREKESLVAAALDRLQPQSVWDLGGNVGRFSRLATQRDAYTVCLDIDPACVEANYLQTRRDGDEHLLPLVLDLANPSPALGWSNTERPALLERGPADLVLALGLVHHLAIGLNVPLNKIADLCSRLAPQLIVEFVPRGDSQIDKLLSSRTDVFANYHREGFESAFGRHYSWEPPVGIPGTARHLYVMRHRMSGPAASPA